MLKKSLIAGAAITLLAVLFLGRSAPNYISTLLGNVQESVEDHTPIQFQIDQAKQMIKKLDPEIRSNMHEIAKEEVNVEKLTRDVAKHEAKMATAREEILQLKTDLDEGQSYYTYAGDHYTSDQVESNLKSRFQRFKTDEATTKNLKQILNVRKQGLDSAREKLVEMRNAKEQLNLEIANLESRLKMVEVAKTTSEYNFDDSALSRTRELIEKIGTRIDVEAKLANADVDSTADIPVNVKIEKNVDVSKEIADYFGSDSAQAEVATK